MAYKLFAGYMEKKDIAHASERTEQNAAHRKEREELMRRLDTRDIAFEKLQSDIRNTFATNLTENGNIIRQAIIHLHKQRTRKDATMKRT